MYKFTNPILEDLKETDTLLIRAYKKVAKACARQGNESAKKAWLKKMFDAIRHRKGIQQEIEQNERDYRKHQGSTDTEDGQDQ